MAAYKLRKEKFLSRSKQMIHFVKEQLQCRSQVIGSYFGDNALTPCGICDNCLRQKSINLSRQEFDSIHTAILRITPGKTMHIKDLLLQLNDVKKEKAWKVIEFLQAENKIKIDDKGWLKLT